jgi:hypothetical protein
MALVSKTWKSSGLTVACGLSQSRRVRTVIVRAVVEGDARLRTSCDEDGSEKTNGSVFLKGWLDGSEKGKGERVRVGEAEEAGARAAVC